MHTFGTQHSRYPQTISFIVALLLLVPSWLATPGNVAAEVGIQGTYSTWYLPAHDGGYYNLDQPLVPRNDPAALPGQVTPTYFYATEFGFQHYVGVGGYVGLQTDERGKRAIFSVWDADGAECAPVTGAFCGTFTGEGNGYSTQIPYDWQAGHQYRVRVWANGSDAGGDWWLGAVLDDTAGTDTIIGRLHVPTGRGWLDSWALNFVEWYGGRAATCDGLALSLVSFGPPIGNAGETMAGAPVNEYGSGACPSAITTEGGWATHRNGSTQASSPSPAPLGCPSPGQRVPGTIMLPAIDVQVKIPNKPISIDYGQLPLTFTSITPNPGAICSVESNRGALPVLLSLRKNVFGQEIEVGHKQVASSVTHATLDFLPNSSVHVVECDFSLIKALSRSITFSTVAQPDSVHDCYLNRATRSAGGITVRWHIPGFEEYVPNENGVRVYATQPLTYYLDLDTLLGQGYTNNITSIVQNAESYFHTKLVRHLPSVSKIGIVQDPPAHLLLTDPAGRQVGYTTGGLVEYPMAGYMEVDDRSVAWVLEPGEGTYIVEAISAPGQPYALNFATIDLPSEDEAAAVVSRDYVGTIPESGFERHTHTFVPPTVPNPALNFADVPADYWAHDQIGQFATRGITTGCGDNDQGQRLYCPERGVTRAEMATFITRTLGQDKVTPPTTPTFADVPTDYWAYGQIEAFAQLGITTGCGLNELGQRIFCPDRGVTRAEMAAFIDRAKGQAELPSGSPTFADVPADYWAYGWIERFFTLGVTTGCGEDDNGNKVYCPDRGVTRAEMAVFIIRAYP